MSYMRCLSNPEGLYIVHCGGPIEIFSSGKEWRIPRHIFHGLFLRWQKNHGPVKYRGASLSETPDFRWSLNYKGWTEPIVMWKVTTAYVAESVRERVQWNKKNT
jgi:hypothetical protein